MENLHQNKNAFENIVKNFIINLLILKDILKKCVRIELFINSYLKLFVNVKEEI